MARGAFPDSHPQHLGMPGMHGTVAAVDGAAEGRPAGRARRPVRRPGHRQAATASRPDAPIVHADIDPAEIGKNRKADVPIVGDAKETIAELIDGACAAEHEAGRTRRPHRLVGAARRLAASATRSATTSREDGTLVAAVRDRAARRDRRPGRDLRRRRRPAPDVGRPVHLVREARAPGSTPAASGTMGYAVPAAMGAKFGRPDATVWAIDGDGCFQMTNQELATCAIEGIPIKVAVINNGNLGMVRQWQTLFYEGRYSNTDLHGRTPTVSPSRRIPDFVKLAEALGCVGLRCETKDDVDAMIEKAMAINDAPVVIDFVVGKDAQVWPMVAAGTSNDEILAARDVRPVFGDGTGLMSHEQAHALGAGGEQARCPGPGRGAVQPARVQHRVPRRRADRAPRALPHDDRRRRRGPAARADHQAAEQADQRPQDRRAGRRPPRCSASCCWSRSARRWPSAPRCWRPPSCSGPGWSTSPPTR